MRLKAQSVFENLPLACLIITMNGRVARANALAQDLFQHSENSLRGQVLTDVLTDSEELSKLIKTASERGASVSSPELFLRTAQETVQRVSVHLSAYDEKNWLLIFTPIAEVAVSTRANLLKEKAGSLSAMAAMLAHEIKNPLAAIRGAAQLMSRADPEMADLIVDETLRISNLLDTMDLFSSPDELAMGPINLHAVLSRVIKSAEAGFGANLRFAEDYDPSLPAVLGNEQILHRILTNLIKNACEACPGHAGLIQVRTRFHLSERRRVEGAGQPDLPVLISVIDNGRGIEPDMQSQIFDAFISTKDQGRGLGLAYVAGAISSLGGRIDLSSNPGRTEFQLRLPRA